jgi:alkylation response protein AidB-like acyl-CoA dehydrogenase
MTVTVDRTAEHDEIRSVARRFLEREYPSTRLRARAETDHGFEASDWARIAELGWPAISLAEEYGGVGYGMAERCLLLEEMGRVLLPGPFLSSAVLAADLISLGATGAHRATLLPSIADGSLLATVVAAGDFAAGSDPAGAVTASATADGAWTLSGRGGLVLDAGGAELLVVVARLADGSGPEGVDPSAGSVRWTTPGEVPGGIGVFAVGSRSDGVSSRPVDIIDRTRRVASVEFSGAGAGRLDGGAGTAEAVAAALHRGTVSLAAEMIGGAQRCLDLTLDYLKNRHQFGKPIGSFQALKHRCADLAVAVDSAREAVHLAVEVIDSGQAADVAAVAAAAKIKAGDAYLLAANETIQLHGGIGFTWEHDAHLFYKRALSSAQLLGTAVDHRARLADELGV